MYIVLLPVFHSELTHASLYRYMVGVISYRVFHVGGAICLYYYFQLSITHVSNVRYTLFFWIIWIFILVVEWWCKLSLITTIFQPLHMFQLHKYIWLFTCRRYSLSLNTTIFQKLHMFQLRDTWISDQNYYK